MLRGLRGAMNPTRSTLPFDEPKLSSDFLLNQSSDLLVQQKHLTTLHQKSPELTLEVVSVDREILRLGGTITPLPSAIKPHP